MTLATRVVNRLTLSVLAALGAVLSATAGWPLVFGGAPMPLVAPVEAALHDAAQGAGIPVATWPWIAAGAIAVLVAIALAIILTRPVRHPSAAVDDGEIVIEEAVISGLLRDALADVPDLLSVSAVTERQRRERVVRLRIQVRPRADLALLQRRLASAVDDTDRRLGLPVPLVVQLTGGLRSTFAHERRVA